MKKTVTPSQFLEQRLTDIRSDVAYQIGCRHKTKNYVFKIY